MICASWARRRLDDSTPGGGSDELRSTALQVQTFAVAANGLFLVTAGMAGFTGEAEMVS